MKKIFVALTILGIWHGLAAGSEMPRVVLDERGPLSNDCLGAFRELGVACLVVGEEVSNQIASNQYDNDKLWADVQARTERAIPSSNRAIKGPLEQLLGEDYRVALVLTERQTKEGQAYVTGFPVVFSTTTFSRTGARLDGVPGAVWDALGDRVRFAEVGSQAEAQYFARLDAPVLRERARREAEEKRVEAERQAQRQRETPAYKAEEASSQIKGCVKAAHWANAGIEREKRIGAVSGVVNKSALYSYGLTIANCEASIPRYWATYKKNGGSARSVNDLTRDVN